MARAAVDSDEPVAKDTPTFRSKQKIPSPGVSAWHLSQKGIISTKNVLIFQKAPNVGVLGACQATVSKKSVSPPFLPTKLPARDKIPGLG